MKLMSNYAELLYPHKVKTNSAIRECIAQTEATCRQAAAAYGGNSGSTGWPGAFRSHLHLHSPKADPGAAEVDQADPERVLTRKKSNWTKAGETIPMHWEDGVFVRNAPPTGILGSIESRTCQRVFLDLLYKTAAEKQPVSSNSKSGNYAPKLFAGRPDRERFTKTDFVRAKQILFVAGEIQNEDYGRKHDMRSRIVRRQKEAA